MRWNRRIARAAWVIVFPFALLAQEMPAQERVRGGVLVGRIDSIADAVLRAAPAASFALGVRQGDDIILMRAYGYADLENGVPATVETVYRIGSLTKQFTAAAVMKLVGTGLIELDAPVTRYLPDYPMHGQNISIRHLLAHTAGVKNYTSLPVWASIRSLDYSDEQMVGLFKDEPLDFAPGDRWQYSNSGYYLLGVAVGAASKSTYGSYQ